MINIIFKQLNLYIYFFLLLYGNNHKLFEKTKNQLFYQV